MFSHLGLLLYINFAIAFSTYLYLYKIRKLIGFQLGMNISMVTGGMIATATGVILIFQFPLNFVTITIISTVVGCGIGALFGGLFDYQTLLTGYANGLMIGIMAPMIGAAANGYVLFIWFIEFVFIFSIILLLLSAKKS